MKILKLIIEITLDIIFTIKRWVSNNLRYIAAVITVALVYGMYIIGQYMFMQRAQFAIGGEAFIPLIVLIIIHYIRSAANKLNKGSKIPKPQKRFTKVSDDGEISIENDRLQEVIVYVSNLGDWLERRGLL